jgi:hypothetical protein
MRAPVADQRYALRAEVLLELRERIRHRPVGDDKQRIMVSPMRSRFTPRQRAFDNENSRRSTGSAAAIVRVADRMTWCNTVNFIQKCRASGRLIRGGHSAVQPCAACLCGSHDRWQAATVAGGKANRLIQSPSLPMCLEQRLDGRRS